MEAENERKILVKLNTIAFLKKRQKRIRHEYHEEMNRLNKTIKSTQKEIDKIRL